MECCSLSNYIYNILNNAVESYTLRLDNNSIHIVKSEIISDLYQHINLMKLSNNFKYTLPQNKLIYTLTERLTDEVWYTAIPWIYSITYYIIVLINLCEHWGYLNPNINWA